MELGDLVLLALDAALLSERLEKKEGLRLALTMVGLEILLYGIFIIGFIYNGITMIGIDANWQSIIRGLIIIGTVMLDMAINGRSRS